MKKRKATQIPVPLPLNENTESSIQKLLLAIDDEIINQLDNNTFEFSDPNINNFYWISPLIENNIINSSDYNDHITALTFTQNLQSNSKIKFESFDTSMTSVTGHAASSLRENVTLFLDHDTTIIFAEQASENLANEAIICFSKLTQDRVILAAIKTQNDHGYLTFDRDMPVKKVEFIAKRLKLGRHLLLTKDMLDEKITTVAQAIQPGRILVLDAQFSVDQCSLISSLIKEGVILKDNSSMINSLNSNALQPVHPLLPHVVSQKLPFASIESFVNNNNVFFPPVMKVSVKSDFKSSTPKING